MDQSLLNKLKNIALLVFDVDGVLTRPEVIHSDNGEIKIFNSQDGFGITMARQAGLKTAILTGRISKPVKKRAEELHIDFYEAGHFNKEAALLSIQKHAHVDASQTLYMGDDVLDLICKKHVGIFAAPKNAATRVLQMADWITEAKGGKGCVREVIEAVLTAQNKLTQTEDYFINGGKKK